MTVSEAIITWLRQFEIENIHTLETVNTDLQDMEEYTYSLVKEPTQNVKSYVSGKKVYTDHYMIQARLPSRFNTERMENVSFGEELEGWVREQNKLGIYPVIPNTSVKDIGITTPFYVGYTNENNSVYQMTIAIKYEKEM